MNVIMMIMIFFFFFFFFFFLTGTMTTCHSKFIGTHIEIHILQK